MQLPITLPGFELRNIIVETGGPFSAPHILVDGEPPSKGPKRGQFLLRRNDGTDAVGQFRTLNFLDPIPQLLVDGKAYPLVKPLKWYQWLWAGIPFLLLIIGGALGGLFGALGLYINSRVFRSGLNNIAKYLATAGVSLVTILGFLGVAAIFQLSITNLFARPQEYKSSPGRFSIITAAKFSETSQPAELPNVGQIEIHTFSGQRGKTAYFVGYTDYPASFVLANDPTTMLEGSRDGAARSVSGTVLADTAITLDGNSGREFVVDGKTAQGQVITIRARIFLVENRLYQVFVVAPKENVNVSEADAFLQSFKLIVE